MNIKDRKIGEMGKWGIRGKAKGRNRTNERRLEGTGGTGRKVLGKGQVDQEVEQRVKG